MLVPAKYPNGVAVEWCSTHGSEWMDGECFAIGNGEGTCRDPDCSVWGCATCGTTGQLQPCVVHQLVYRPDKFEVHEGEHEDATWRDNWLAEQGFEWDESQRWERWPPDAEG